MLSRGTTILFLEDYEMYCNQSDLLQRKLMLW